MHWQNPRQAIWRGYVGGGARGSVDKADDTNYLQTIGTGFMKGEQRSYVEAPQNYGFTSVHMPADREESSGGGVAGTLGKIKRCAEFFGTFSGGQRTMGWGIIDDPRHRLYKLIEGAVAMYCPKEWGQQFLLHKDGMFMSGNEEKKIKLQLVQNKNNQQQQLSQQQQANGTSGTSGSGQSQTYQYGQETLHEEQTTTYIEATKDKVTIKRGNGHVTIEDNKIMTYWTDDTVSTRVDDKHVHIRYKNNRIWVDDTGCWSTVPMQVQQDPNDGGGGGTPYVPSMQPPGGEPQG